MPLIDFGKFPNTNSSFETSKSTIIGSKRKSEDELLHLHSVKTKANPSEDNSTAAERAISFLNSSIKIDDSIDCPLKQSVVLSLFEVFIYYSF